MTIQSSIIAVAFALLASAAVSAAPTITFDGTPDNYDDLQSYDGFDFDFAANGWGVVAGDFGCCSGQNVLNGTNHLMLSGGSPGSVTISKGGVVFSIASFDSATAFLGTDGQMLVTGIFDGGGTISTLFDLNPTYESHVLVGYSNLVAMVFAESGNSNFKDYGLGLDNLAFDAGPAVPEPATWAMLITGFGLVGFAARRRQDTAVSA